jgi:hypothetical protein
VRVWDQVDPALMCRQHLLGEHREVHGLWNAIRRIHAGEERVGYANHPETRRWLMHPQALLIRHERLRFEMHERGYRHESPLRLFLVRGVCSTRQPEPLDDQAAALRAKGCACKV